MIHIYFGVYIICLMLLTDCALYVTSKTRDDLFEEMLQEPNEIAVKRKRCRELLRAYQQAFRVRLF